MTALCNAKHEAFAKELAKGNSASKSYALAGFAPHRQNAHRLMTSDDIQRRVKELKEQREIDNKNGRDPNSGRFLPGNSGNGGRQRGSRSKLAEQFIADLHDEWEVSGATALKRVAQSDPVAFVKIAASILPAKIDTTLTINAELFQEIADFREAWKLARSFIGADASEDGERVDIGGKTMFPDPPLLELQANDD